MQAILERRPPPPRSRCRNHIRREGHTVLYCAVQVLDGRTVVRVTSIFQIQIKGECWVRTTARVGVAQISGEITAAGDWVS